MRGIDEDWLRRKRGRVTAVRCAFDCPRVFPPPLAVKTRLMCGSLVFARSSRSPRRLLASASASASASGFGRAHGPNTGPLPCVGCRGEAGHRRPSRWNLPCCWGGLPGLTRPTGAARGRFAGGADQTRGALLAGHGARQVARRARKTAERRAASLGGRLRGGSTEWLDEAPEYRIGSLPRENGADQGGPGARC